MSYYLNFPKIAKKSWIEDLKIATGESKQIKTGECALLLSANVHHITGTTSLFKCNNASAEEKVYQSGIDTGEANGDYQLWNTTANSNHGQFCIVVIESSDVLQFTGGTGSYIVLRMLKWRP